MRTIFYMLAALLAFGTAYYYYQEVDTKTATIQKIRIVADKGTVFKEGTVIDDAFMAAHFVSTPVSSALADDYDWAIYDTPANRLHLRGRALTRDVPAGSFLQRERFLGERREAFSMRIAEGNRAFSIPVRAEEAVEIFIAPGARVDVIGTFKEHNKPGQSKRLLENVVVMAVGTFDSAGAFAEEERPEYRSVTLQAPADLVERFMAESSDASGGLKLVLRNPCEGVSSCVGPATTTAQLELGE